MLDDECIDIEETPEDEESEESSGPKEDSEECPCPKEESEESLCPKEESDNSCPKKESEKCPEEEETKKCPEEEETKTCPEEETEKECEEDDVAEDSEEDSTCTLVHCGPPLPEPIRYEVINGRVSVPTHFFKMIMFDNDTEPNVKSYKAYVIPNDVNKELCDNWKRFSISLEELEQVSGLEIFSDEYKERLEREMDE